jgi:hypothetical protein
MTRKPAVGIGGFSRDNSSDLIDRSPYIALPPRHQARLLKHCGRSTARPRSALCSAGSVGR